MDSVQEDTKKTDEMVPPLATQTMTMDLCDDKAFPKLPTATSPPAQIATKSSLTPVTTSISLDPSPSRQNLIPTSESIPMAQSPLHS